SVTALRWRALDSNGKAILSFRPFLSGRDYHSLHHENGVFQFAPEIDGQQFVWRPYCGVPGTVVLSNSEYLHRPDWYRSFLYEQERARGLDFTEDLATPGTFTWDLARAAAVCLLGAEGLDNGLLNSAASPELLADDMRAAELLRRQKFFAPLDRAVDAYLVARGVGKTIVAGYPWFTDWGRDTFIALRGLCLATERFDDASDILLQWAEVVSEGMLPNRFPDQDGEPEYNSVDASLWYIIAVNDLLGRSKAAGKRISKQHESALMDAVQAILTGYAGGTRYNIHMDQDGLLAAGVPGMQLTWMDARVGNREVTPRIGKPVEIQALWLNALRIGSRIADRWSDLYQRGRASFSSRFWNDQGGCLYDVIDCDHKAGTADATFRPNQILAVGGLPVVLLEPEKARKVVDAVEARLLTPMGLRSLAPGAPGYSARYEGGPAERDGVYHQGTVWPWLIGPFVEAWMRVHGGDNEPKNEARSRFLASIMEHLGDAGLGHVPEIADAEPPYAPRGCPFQAWSLGELLRLERIVLAAPKTARIRESSRPRTASKDVATVTQPPASSSSTA
ncbi:MAG: amylo-alpha-1,6-glucosidase, partial [Alphaproteobacteria bacterium]